MAENEKSWLERTYGPTWRSIKDPETYKSLLDLSSYGDVIDAPGAPGLVALYDWLGGPSTKEWKELGSSYDSKWDAAQDAGRFALNSIINNAKIGADIGADVLQAPFNDVIYDEQGNPTGMKPWFSNEFKYGMDAKLSDTFGFPTLIKDNPYAAEDAHLMENIYSTAQKETDNYFKDEIKNNDKDKDGYHDSIYEEIAKDMPEYSEWAYNNPRADVEDYQGLFDDKYDKKISNKYDKQWNEMLDSSVQSQLSSKYGIKENQPTVLDKFELSMDYDPYFKYESPRADIIEEAAPLGEMAASFGTLGLIKKFGKTAAQANKNWKQRFDRPSEGIMSNRKQIEGPNKISPGVARKFYNRVNRAAQRRGYKR
jgi:hypothetical protein